MRPGLLERWNHKLQIEAWLSSQPEKVRSLIEKAAENRSHSEGIPKKVAFCDVTIRAMKLEEEMTKSQAREHAFN